MGGVVSSKVRIEEEAEGDEGGEGSGAWGGGGGNGAEWSHSDVWARCVLCLRSSLKSKVGLDVSTWGPGNSMVLGWG